MENDITFHPVDQFWWSKDLQSYFFMSKTVLNGLDDDWILFGRFLGCPKGNCPYYSTGRFCSNPIISHPVDQFCWSKDLGSYFLRSTTVLGGLEVDWATFGWCFFVIRELVGWHNTRLYYKQRMLLRRDKTSTFSTFFGIFGILASKGMGKWPGS